MARHKSATRAVPKSPCIVAYCGFDLSTEKVIRRYQRRGFTVIRKATAFPLGKGMAERSIHHFRESNIKNDELADRIQDAIRRNWQARMERKSIMEEAGGLPSTAQRLEIDKFRLDIDLVAENGTILCRPLVTVVIDSYSKTLLEMHVSQRLDEMGDN